MGGFCLLQPPFRQGGTSDLPGAHTLGRAGNSVQHLQQAEGVLLEVNRIEVLSPIRYISFKRNEVKSKVRDKPIYADEDRTQRQTVALRDVRYRFAASICPRPDFAGTAAQLYAQALRRIREGKTFVQPSLGLKEFVAYFQEGDRVNGPRPIPVDMDLGLMVYDVFDLHDAAVRKKAQPRLSLYHCVMEQGVIRVPPYDSPEVLKGEAPC